MKNKFILGTRGSLLALEQSEQFRQSLLKVHPQAQCEKKVIVTTGDQNTSQKFSELGAKGVFTKELDEALLGGSIDFAVHSLKDLPSELPSGLTLACASAPKDERDAFLSLNHASMEQLPVGAKVGTSSLRRQALVRELYPKLQVCELRGNIDSRIEKLKKGQYDAILLAAAGTQRLGLTQNVREYLDPKVFIPAIGQGVLGVVCRAKDQDTLGFLKPLNDANTWVSITAQRLFMQMMEGGCQVPLGCYGVIRGSLLTLYGYLANVDATQVIREEVQGELTQALSLAKELSEKMNQQGAQGILKKLRER